jgi:hypothetical protein
MRKIVALCMVVLCGVAFSLPVRAQQALPAGEAEGPCAPAAEAAQSLPVTAVVSKIDLRQGRATLETSVGQLELASAPAELRPCRPGMCSRSVSMRPRSPGRRPQRLPRAAEPSA